MKNTILYIKPLLDKLYEILPEDIGTYDVRASQEESIENNLQIIFKMYHLDDELIGIEADSFSKEVQKYNLSHIYLFSSLGSKTSLLNDVSTIIDAELYFWENKLGYKYPNELEEFLKLKGSDEYQSIMRHFQDYMERCCDLKILSNKMINLLEHESNQKEIKLFSRNPLLKDFFEGLKNSERLTNEFRLYIQSIKNNKNRFLDNIL